MMNAKVHELLNAQINKEFYSAYLYLEFSNYFDDAGLDGFANWYMIQAQEERDHAMLFFKYLQNENQKITLEAIDKPTVKISCHMDVLKAGLAIEYKLHIGAVNIVPPICSYYTVCCGVSACGYGSQARSG